MIHQPSLFGAEPGLPEGFQYQPDLVLPEYERLLLQQLADLPLRSFEFQGYLGKRRVVSYGWQYDFNDRVLRKADDIPPFLLPLRELAAGFAGVAAAELSHLLVTEYAAGAGIGWHRDKGMFGDVVGISLLSPCRFRLRRKDGARWERVSLNLEPRSVYLLRGPSRTEWEHSIPETEALRYSLTFRTLRGTGA
ncbi:MAG TPA: alpha-ketoglutarate-dependent dioxygenase AlkB [Armatimonadota bacterium]|nr:alpha-ketoglutarate-dependent dioxygenase AlkB [Armatimonadota bacterium]